MGSGYYDQIIKILKNNGFIYIKNCKGSHELWAHSDGRIAHVPYSTKSRFTAQVILKQANIKEKI
ncbi:MAG TPA: type II toxin-antitoxin system HicA family toxin [Succinivibrionaceae bacterium]|nr:type II toxin-antitoxin system HicA family toxin [Succinivibrionaceae bacterium]